MSIPGLTYALGTREPIAEIEELKKVPAVLAELQAQGLNNYSRIEWPNLFLLLESCIPKTLRESGIRAEQVDAVVIASSTVLGRVDGPWLAQFFRAFNFPH